jgi:colanic acid/amylovoran biosynthesis glycosyltransferase
MIKLAVFTPEFCYPSETFIVDSTKLDPKYFEVSVVTFKLTDFARKNLSKKIKVEITSRSHLKEVLQKYDFIHVHYLNNLREIPEKTLFNKHVLVTCHGEDVFKFGRDFFYRLQLKNKLSLVSQFLPVSKNLAVDLKQKFKVLESRITVLPLGINIEKYLFKLKPKLSRPLKLGVAARLVEYKGIDDLIKAGQILKKLNIDFEIHIIGTGPEENRLKKLAQKLNITNLVLWHGWLGGQKLVTALKKLDVYIAPYKTARDGAKDSMTMILKEMMALGIPVISTTNSAIPELITSGKQGLLVSENNPKAIVQQIIKLTKNKTLRLKLVRQARARIQKDFDLKNQTQSWLLLKLFQNL